MFSTQQEADNLIASFRDDIKQLNTTRAKLVSQRQSNQEILHSTVSLIEASATEISTAADRDSISQLTDNTTSLAEVYDEDFQLIEMALVSKNESINAIKDKNVGTFMDSADDQDLIQIVLEWNDESLAKLNSERREIMNYITNTQNLKDLLVDTQKTLNAVSATATSPEQKNND